MAINFKKLRSIAGLGEAIISPSSDRAKVDRSPEANARARARRDAYGDAEERGDKHVYSRGVSPKIGKQRFPGVGGTPFERGGQTAYGPRQAARNKSRQIKECVEELRRALGLEEKCG